MDKRKYDLKELLNYGRATSNRGLGFAFTFMGGINTLYDIGSWDFDFGTLLSVMAIGTGVAFFYNTRERIAEKLVELFHQEDKLIVNKENIESVLEVVDKDIKERLSE